MNFALPVVVRTIILCISAIILSCVEGVEWKVTEATNMSAVLEILSAGDIVTIQHGRFSDPSFCGVELHTPNVTVRGLGDVMIDCSGHSSRHMHILGANITIQGLSFSNGIAENGENGGCILISGNNAVIKGCNISGCTATWGGGIWVSDDIDFSTVMENVVISGCTAERGGGIGAASTLTIKGDFWSIENQASLVGGAIYLHVDKGKVIFESGKAALFERNSAWFGGGGIFLFDGGLLVAQRPMNFSENRAHLYGGAIFVQSSKLDVQDVVFHRNTVASQGGALNCKSKPGMLPTTATFHGDVIFVSNSVTGLGDSDGYGGAIKAEGTPQLPATIEFRKSLQMLDNQARYGGGLYTYDSANISVGRLSASRNQGAFGGAVSLRNSEMRIQEGALDSNEAQRGGAFYLSNSRLTAANCALAENLASEQGGALALLQKSTATLSNVSFESNRLRASTTRVSYGPTDQGCKPSDPCGGGAVFVSESELEASGAAFRDNAAPDHDGGAVLACGSARVALSQANFINNSAGANGGAIAAVDQSTLVVSGSLLVRNQAGAEGGALFAQCAGVTLASSNISSNRAGSNGAGIATYSALMAHGYSIFRDNAATGSGGAIFASGFPAQVSVGLDGALEIANNSAGRSGGGAALQLAASFRVEFKQCPETCAPWLRGNGLCDTDWCAHIRVSWALFSFR